MALAVNNTYTPIATYTVSGTSTNSYTFTNVSQAYTDLILVINAGTDYSGSSYYCFVQVGNGSVDTGNNYSDTQMYGTGSSALSRRDTNQGYFYPGEINGAGGSGPQNIIINFQNYSNSSTYKTMLARANNSNNYVFGSVGLWRNTSAINTIKVYAGSQNFSSGSTFTLYGVGSTTSSTPKASGGSIYSDSTYYYHVFTNSGTFTPSQSLTCDYVVVGGGASGGSGYFGGGGGAGGYRTATSQSLSATGYTVTIGAGGAANPAGSGYAGGTTTFNSLSSSGGGYGGAAVAGGSGGSGGGGSAVAGAGRSGGSGNSGSYSPVEGYNGGSGYSQSDGASTGGGGGGGGASANGGNCQAHTGGAGGTGTYSALTDAVQIGELSGGHYYIAGGGGGGENYPYGGGTNYPGPAGLGGGGIGGLRSVSNPSSGMAGTGAGGGGAGGDAYATAGNGGSGLVIVRYAK